MIKLLAKSQTDGRYYFIEDEESVYMIKAPLAEAQKEFVDVLPVFLEKSFNSSLVYDNQEFQNFEELRAFAISDSAPEKRGADLTSQESLEDLLIYAPVEIVEEYFEMIENMITRKEFIGINDFFKQLSRNYVLLGDTDLVDRNNELKRAFDEARFPGIIDRDKANRASTRIKEEHSVLSFAC